MGDERSRSRLEPRRISVVQQPGHLVARGSVEITRSLPVPDAVHNDKMSVQIAVRTTKRMRTAHLAFASVEIYPVLAPNVAHYLWLSTRSDTSSHAPESRSCQIHQKPPMYRGIYIVISHHFPTHQYNPIFKQRHIFQDYTNCLQRCP